MILYLDLYFPISKNHTNFLNLLKYKYYIYLVYYSRLFWCKR